jgi:hypothetical protein
MQDNSSVPAVNSGSQSPATDKPTNHAEYDNFALISGARRSTLLALFCFAVYLDAFSNCALFSAIPPISVQLGISNSNAVWLISGYQLTFASFLLVVHIVAGLKT